MFLLANFMAALATVLGMALTAYTWMFIISALLSWVNPDPYNPIVRFLRRATEPVLFRLRNRLPFLYTGGLDLSPLAAILVLVFLEQFLVGSLRQAAFIIAQQVPQ